MIYESPQNGRTAFHLRKVHENHGRTASITAIALQQDADRLYLGFSDGQLEEYRILAGPVVGTRAQPPALKAALVPPSACMQSCTRHDLYSSTVYTTHLKHRSWRTRHPPCASLHG